MKMSRIFLPLSLPGILNNLLCRAGQEVQLRHDPHARRHKPQLLLLRLLPQPAQPEVRLIIVAVTRYISITLLRFASQQLGYSS